MFIQEFIQMLKTTHPTLASILDVLPTISIDARVLLIKACQLGRDGSRLEEWF
jgi:hypothetical protein